MVLGVVAAGVFALVWLLRYTDPGNELGGLLDDHFFYSVPGWQMLFGELPDRDFADPGAPLTYVISAALQLVLGRSIWSEFIFCVTALAAGAAITFVLAARASRSIVLGLLAVALETALIPRLYNYPKILIYAVAIAVVWAWAARPRVSRTWWLAVVTAVAFLVRHDHGVYVAAGFGVLLLCLRDLPWRERRRHAVMFAGATLLLLAPYLVYLQVNGGVLRHLETAYRWSARDYVRAPLVLPTIEWVSLSEEDASNDAPASEWWNHAPFPSLDEHYSTWWIYWLMMLTPIAATILVFLRPPTGPPEWPRERAKVLAVAALAMVLDVRFLRGNLAGRFADASVPFVILAAWSFAALLTIAKSGTVMAGASPRPLAAVLRVATGAVAIVVACVTALLVLRPARELLENSRMLEGTVVLRGRLEDVTGMLQHTWPLPPDFADGKGGAAQLALYLQECTSPTDRVLVVPMLPQIAGLAGRAFAGGHIDLRAGFHDTVEEQTLTLERLRRQSVPVVIGPPQRELRDYAESLPLIARYFDQEYVNLGDKELSGGPEFTLLVNRSARVVRTYEPLSFPCFR